MSANFEIWKNKKEGERIVIVLHSCSTGKGDINSFAAKISNSDEFKNLATIYAPSMNIIVAPYLGKQGEWLFYDTPAPRFYDYSRQERTYGNWNMFENGKIMGKYAWDWKSYNVINLQKYDYLLKANLNILNEK